MEGKAADLEVIVSSYKPMDENEYKVFYKSTKKIRAVESLIQGLAMCLMITIIVVFGLAVMKVFGGEINVFPGVTGWGFFGILVALYVIVYFLYKAFKHFKSLHEKIYKEAGIVLMDMGEETLAYLFHELNEDQYQKVLKVTQFNKVVKDKVMDILKDKRQVLLKIDYLQLHIEEFMYFDKTEGSKESTSEILKILKEPKW